jgi:predicted RNA-binding protein with PIN domain
MSLQYIIDAYNIINHPQFSSAAKKSSCIQSSLADFIKLNRLAGSARNRAILVFDGYPPPAQAMLKEDGLVCMFSRKSQADELIRRLVEESAQPRNIVVVSDDKGVQLAARLFHAQVCAVEEFIRGKKNAREQPLAQQDSEEYKISYSNMQKLNAELKKKWLE